MYSTVDRFPSKDTQHVYYAGKSIIATVKLLSALASLEVCFSASF